MNKYIKQDNSIIAINEETSFNIITHSSKECKKNLLFMIMYSEHSFEFSLDMYFKAIIDDKEIERLMTRAEEIFLKFFLDDLIDDEKKIIDLDKIFNDVVAELLEAYNTKGITWLK